MSTLSTEQKIRNIMDMPNGGPCFYIDLFNEIREARPEATDIQISTAIICDELYTLIDLIDKKD